MANVIYLASFPRSGNTWLRFLIANVFNGITRSFAHVDFYNIHDIVPEFHAEKKNDKAETCIQCRLPGFEKFPLIVKTHAPFREEFAHVVLLVRNPFDCLYSYWDYLNRNNGIAVSLAEVVHHELYGMKALVRHANSYISHCPHLMVLTYEQMLSRPEKQLRKILAFMDFEVASRIVDNAVAASSFRAMSRTERREGRKFGNPDFKFVRNGRVGEGVKRIGRDAELQRCVLAEMKKSPVLHLLYG